VLTNVTAQEVVADGAILVSVTAKKIRASPGSVVYNVVDDSEEGVVVGEKEVLVGVFDGAGAQVRRSRGSGGGDGDGGHGVVLVTIRVVVVMMVDRWQLWYQKWW